MTPFQRPTPGIFAVGVGPGGDATVNVFNAQTGLFAFSFLAFEHGFTGGVRVAVGQLNGQDVIIAAAGPGGFPLVRVFSGRDLSLITEFLAYGREFVGGVTLVGDPAPGAGPLASARGVG